MTRVAVCACGFGRRLDVRRFRSLCVIMGTWSLPGSRPFALDKSCHCVRMRGKPHRTRWPLRGMCQHTAARGTQCAAPRRTAQEACPALVSRQDRLARHPCEHTCIEQWHAESEAHVVGGSPDPLTRPTAGLLGWTDRHSDIWMSQGDLTVVAVGRSGDRPHNRSEVERYEFLFQKKSGR